MAPVTELPPRPSLAELKGLVDHALATGGATNWIAVRDAAHGALRLSESPSTQVEVALNAARFFYVTARPAVGGEIAMKSLEFAIERALTGSAAAAANIAGTCAADAGDLAKAMEFFSQGLNLARACGSKETEGKIWQNLAGALVYGGLCKEAIACYRQVLVVFGEVSTDASKQLVGNAHLGIAVASLNLDEIASGLQAVGKALDHLSDGVGALAVQNQVLAYNYSTRLHIEMGDFSTAEKFAKQAREAALRSQSPRSDMQASVAEGLAEAFAGRVDVGITRLTQTLERARKLNVASREVLVALVKALEFAGRHDEALKYLKEMLAQQRQTAEANVLNHVRVHLAKLHERDSDTPMEDLKQAMRRVETRVEIVEGKAAKVELARHRQELFKARVEAMERLAVAAELRDDSTGEHSYRVGRLACILAKEAGCDDETIFMIDIAARLHDVGKIGIPDGILLKPSGFNPAERAVMEMHAEIGADVLVKSEIPHIKMAEEIARHHHERWDGRGYPAKIGSTEIPLAARITSLADVFDALTHKRPYKPAWTFEAATSEILASSGTHFDPELTKLFLALINRLKREHRDLDHFLGEAARASPFIQARGKIWDTLRLAREEYQEQFQRSIDLQR
jgi:putative two-component system response regulator